MQVVAIFYFEFYKKRVYVVGDRQYPFELSH